MFRTIGIISLTVTLCAASIAKSDDTANEKDKTSKAKVAKIALKGEMPESAGAVGLFGDIDPNLRQMILRLDRAAKDESISAVVLRIQNPTLGRGKIEELRAAIARVREKGKKVVAELTMAMSGDYLLACACDEIVMPESGVILVPGVRAEVTFYAGLLEKLGIEADMMQVGDFKGAAEPLTRKSMSKEFRQQYQSLIDDLYDQLVDTIAKDRKLPGNKVKQLIDTGLFTASNAKKAGLIDMVAYDDATAPRLAKQLDVEEVELVAKYGKKKVDTDFSGMMGFIKLFELMAGTQPSQRSSKNKKIAIVYAVGPIMTGASSASVFGSETMGSDTIVKALRKAKDDETVVAIVLRVDSPGGSALASDLIWREITQIKKPIIASMGDTAASGGYYISMGCDKIYAEPGTITGSIGVVGGKLAVGGMFKKVDIHTEVLSRGKNSGLFSTESKFTDSEREVSKKMMEEVYRQFTQKAADGRKMKIEQLEKLAGGRIWTGRQAKKNGLLDELGTLRDALSAAKKQAGLGEGDKVELLVLPKPSNPFDQLLGVSAMAPDVKSAVQSAAPTVSKRVEEVGILRRLFAEPAVLIRPYQIEIK